MKVLQSKYNKTVYYFSEKIMVIRIFEEIHMAKVIFIESKIEGFVDINGISTEPIFEKTIPITLLGGEKNDSGLL
ncbi:hypothetical protein DW918_11060 [Eubacterium ventriosum]|uniref:Uncharacterized protein n=1 Tax=Eubacterium ventriosum TaxID=39496 RepID=A0A413T035_9FIRM|nr:hypothetical protein DW918_11060 [Eubacterium ventriosum]